MSPGSGLTGIATLIGTALIAITSSCTGADHSLVQELLPAGIVAMDPRGNEIWNRPVAFHVDDLAISADGHKVALQGKEGLAYLSVGSNELRIVDSAAGESHFVSGRIAWTPSGDRIVYERDGKILVLDLASKRCGLPPGSASDRNDFTTGDLSSQRWRPIHDCLRHTEGRR